LRHLVVGYAEAGHKQIFLWPFGITIFRFHGHGLQKIKITAFIIFLLWRVLMQDSRWRRAVAALENVQLDILRHDDCLLTIFSSLKNLLRFALLGDLATNSAIGQASTFSSCAHLLDLLVELKATCFEEEPQEMAKWRQLQAITAEVVWTLTIAHPSNKQKASCTRKPSFHKPPHLTWPSGWWEKTAFSFSPSPAPFSFGATGLCGPAGFGEAHWGGKL